MRNHESGLRTSYSSIRAWRPHGNAKGSSTQQEISAWQVLAARAIGARSPSSAASEVATAEILSSLMKSPTRWQYACQQLGVDCTRHSVVSTLSTILTATATKLRHILTRSAFYGPTPTHLYAVTTHIHSHIRFVFGNHFTLTYTLMHMDSHIRSMFCNHFAHSLMQSRQKLHTEGLCLAVTSHTHLYNHAHYFAHKLYVWPIVCTLTQVYIRPLLCTLIPAVTIEICELDPDVHLKLCSNIWAHELHCLRTLTYARYVHLKLCSNIWAHDLHCLHTLTWNYCAATLISTFTVFWVYEAIDRICPLRATLIVWIHDIPLSR